VGLTECTFFDRETFGTRQLVLMGGFHCHKSALAKRSRRPPLSDRARKQIVQIETRAIDYMPGISSAEKKLRRVAHEL